MKNLTKLTKNVEASKEMQKRIKDLRFYSNEQFIKDAQRYIKAIKEGRIICSIGSVSSSGMSRTIKFIAPEKHSSLKNVFHYQNFFCFFKVLGFTEARGREHYFSIGGCGMDMIFHTNYSIIHKLESLGFITKEQCSKLSQMTPSVI